MSYQYDKCHQQEKVLPVSYTHLDNYNDIDMLKSVKYAYVMDTACEDIKKYAYDTTEWVEGTLRKEFNI